MNKLQDKILPFLLAMAFFSPQMMYHTSPVLNTSRIAEIRELLAIQDPNALIAYVFGADGRIMQKVAFCESGGTHYNKDGSVIENKKTGDVGLMQINESIWGKTAKKLGLDIYEMEDNVRMAKYILKVQGLNAWKPSFQCWRTL